MVLGVLALGMVAWAAEHSRNQRIPAPVPTEAAAGNCSTLHHVRPGGQARLVSCDDSAAQFTILQVVSGSSDRRQCAEVPGSEFAFALPPTLRAQRAVVCVTLLHVQGRGAAE